MDRILEKEILDENSFGGGEEEFNGSVWQILETTPFTASRAAAVFPVPFITFSGVVAAETSF